MFALYLFTIVFVSLCLLVADKQPTCSSFAIEGINYETIETLDTLHWITEFVAEESPTPANNTITAEPKPTIVTSKDTVVEPDEAMTDAFEARVKEITEAMTKAAILSEIKSHGWWEPNLSRMSKAELARVKATRE